MTPTKIGQITNADVYMGTARLVGRFKEFTLPAREYHEIKHETLGQIAILSLPARPLKELTGKGMIDFVDPDLYPLLCNPTAPMQLALHSYVDIFGSDGLDRSQSYRLVTNVTMMVRKMDGKPFKLGDAFEGDFEYSALRLSQGISGGGVPFFEIDVMQQINRVMGQDVWPAY